MRRTCPAAPDTGHRSGGRYPSVASAPQSQSACWPVAHHLHTPQLGTNAHTTWSPGFTRVTPDPTCSITPAPSWPATIGSRAGMSPLGICRSEWHSPAYS